MTGSRCFCDASDGCSDVCWLCVEAGSCAYTPPPPPPTPAELHRARLDRIDQHVRAHMPAGAA